MLVELTECSLIIGTGCRVQVLAWSSIAQSVCQRAFSLLEIRFQRSFWVRILHLAEEDNLSPFDSIIACLCQSIEINNNKQPKWWNYWPFRGVARRRQRGPGLNFKMLKMWKLPRRKWPWKMFGEEMLKWASTSKHTCTTLRPCLYGNNSPIFHIRHYCA